MKCSRQDFQYLLITIDKEVVKIHFGLLNLDIKCPKIIFLKMLSKESFGEHIRNLRESGSLPLRKVAAVLDIDPSTLSKIERGDRFANREHLALLANLFQVEEANLTLIYLSDKVARELISESNSYEILEAAEQKIRYLRSKNVTQESLKFSSNVDK